MKKTIYSKFGPILIVKGFNCGSVPIYDLYLDGEFITEYKTSTPFDIKKFEYEIIDYFDSIIK